MASGATVPSEEVTETPERSFRLMRLISHRFTREALAWAVIGATGVVVNQLALWFFVNIGLGLVLANILNTPVSTTWNFWWLEKRVYHGGRRHRMRRWLFLSCLQSHCLF